MTLVCHPFGQWMKQWFVEVNGLNLTCANSITVCEGKVYALTQAGLISYDGKDWAIKNDNTLNMLTKPYALLPQNCGLLWIATKDGIFELGEGKLHKISDMQGVQAWHKNEDVVWVALNDGLWKYEKSWEFVTKFPSMGKVRAIAAREEQVVLATSWGVWFLQGKRPHFKELLAGYTPLPTNDIRDAVFDRSAHLWLATDKGIVILCGNDTMLHLTGEDGLPIEDLHRICLAKDGGAWFASPCGAVWLKDGEWTYFASKRWLPSDEVNQIAVTEDDTAFIATKDGIAKLWQKQMTLSEKADVFDQQVQKRHRRFNYVTVRRLEREGDVQSGSVEISDNDGLWTALYSSAQCFRYAVTVNENRFDEAKDALKKACESLSAILFLERVTNIPGFPARAVRHKSETEFGTPHPEWHRIPDGNWEWKGDTSSDEIVGHFFAYAIGYDLLPDDAPYLPSHHVDIYLQTEKTVKAEIVETVKRILEHIIRNDFYLVDVDGQPTTWGVWAPEKLNHDETWWADRGLNSLQILSFLKVGWHMTGDRRYETIYRELISKHSYALNTVRQKVVVNGLTNHSDDELAFLSYYILLRYETDPNLLRLFLTSLERTWLLERKEMCPLWNFIYGALTGKVCDVELAVKTLCEIPMDLIHWDVRNSHRCDIQKHEALDRFNELQSIKPLSFLERPLHKWNGNPYRLDESGKGLLEEDATFFLLPYWLGRYHNLFVTA